MTDNSHLTFQSLFHPAFNGLFTKATGLFQNICLRFSYTGDRMVTTRATTPVRRDCRPVNTLNSKRTSLGYHRYRLMVFFKDQKSVQKPQINHVDGK